MDKPEIDKSKLAFNLSHSSIELLEKCPYSFYERYVMKFYPEVEPNYASEFGSLIHEASQFYKGTGRAEFEFLVEKFRHKYLINDEYADKIPLAISNYLFFHEVYLVGAKKIYKEKSIQILLNEYVGFNGSIDILYQQEDDSWVVVDLKSSKKPGDYSKQLSCYYYLLSKISNKTPSYLNCKVVYLVAPTEDKIIQPYSLDKDDLEICEQRLLSAVNKISLLGVDDVSQWKKKVTPLCPWCDLYKAGVCQGKDNFQPFEK